MFNFTKYSKVLKLLGEISKSDLCGIFVFMLRVWTVRAIKKAPYVNQQADGVIHK